MFVNEEILKKYDPCDVGLRFMRKFYPDGVEVINLLDNQHVPLDILHWGAENLPVSNEEMNKYYEVCKIYNSKNCHESKEVEHSSYIYKSEKIFSSKKITKSKNVRYSEDVSYSKNISNSLMVVHSSNIEKSKFVNFGININNSFYISNSTDVNFSSNIKESISLERCHIAWKIRDCEDVIFSSFIEKGRQLLFCSNLSCENLKCFNKPIDKKNYDEIKSELLTKLVEEKEKNLERYRDPNPTSIFKLSEKFYKWVKTLPGYDEFIMYQITFDKKWLD